MVMKDRLIALSYCPIVEESKKCSACHVTTTYKPIQCTMKSHYFETIQFAIRELNEIANKVRIYKENNDLSNLTDNLSFMRVFCMKNLQNTHKRTDFLLNLTDHFVSVECPI